MAESRMKIEQQYPELFAQLTDTERRAVVQSLAAAWHEGFNPTRESVENLTDYVRGAIDADEYDRRADSAARRPAAAARRAAHIEAAVSPGSSSRKSADMKAPVSGAETLQIEQDTTS